MDEKTCYIFAVPEQVDPIWRASSQTPPHATIMVLPLSAQQRAFEVINSIFMDPFSAKVESRGELGEHKADVLFLGASRLSEIRQYLLSDPEILEAYNSIEQFPSYTPHVTLGYPEEPPLGGEIPTEITFAGIGIHGDDDPDDLYYGVELKSEPSPEDYLEHMVDQIPVYGVLTVEGMKTGDKREFDTDSLTWDTPPLSLRWQEIDSPGHDNSIIIGSIDQIWREGQEIRFNGKLLLDENADKFLELSATGSLRGISVDLDATTATYNEETDELVVHQGRIRSAAALPIQAYVEAWIKIGTWQ